MYQWLSIVPLAPLLLLSVGACEASQTDSVGAKVGRHTAANEPAAASDWEKTVTNEQVPISRQFRNLDEYLAHLERMEGPVDGPWYKEIRPGVYELQTGNLRVLGDDGQKQTFTREELERKFGFSE